MKRPVGQEPIDRGGHRLGFEGVRRQAHAEPSLVDPLGVVVLVPEERQQDHRQAIVEALGDRVVAAVGDHQVDLGRSARWGTNSAPTMLSARAYRSAWGPFETTNRWGVAPRTSTSRRMRSTSAEPRLPRLR